MIVTNSAPRPFASKSAATVVRRERLRHAAKSWSTFAESDKADIVADKKGNPTPDSDLRDYENVPLKETIEDYVEREVLPYVPDAWVDGDYTRTGYEIPFTRFFYRYEPPRPLDAIEAEIQGLEREIQSLLGGAFV